MDIQTLQKEACAYEFAGNRAVLPIGEQNYTDAPIVIDRREYYENGGKPITYNISCRVEMAKDISESGIYIPANIDELPDVGYLRFISNLPHIGKEIPLECIPSGTFKALEKAAEDGQAIITEEDLENSLIILAFLVNYGACEYYDLMFEYKDKAPIITISKKKENK